MKVLEFSVRPETAENEILLGTESPEPLEKRHLKEIVMNGEVQESSATVEHKIQSSGPDSGNFTADSDCENVTSSTTNGHTENEIVATDVDKVEKEQDCVTNGNSNGIKEGDSDSTEVVTNGHRSNEEKEENKAISKEGSVSENVDIEEKNASTNDEVMEETSLEKDVNEEKNALQDLQCSTNDKEKEDEMVAKTKDIDDTSSTEDEDIRLVMEDALDEVDKEEQDDATTENKDKQEEKNKEPLSPACVDGLALDNITSNFDEDSCSSFDKSLEEVTPKKTEPVVEVQAVKCADSTDSVVSQSEEEKIKPCEVDSMEVDEDKSIITKLSNDLGRKRSIASSEPDEIESKKIKPTDIEDKKVPADEVSTSFKIEKLERTVRTMTRQELEKFLVDSFLVNMTRKSQMAVQEQELNKMKLKCETFKKNLASVTKLCSDLKNTVTQIADINKNSAKIVKPKNIVRHVAIQVPSKTLVASSPPQLPEKKLRTLPPVQRKLVQASMPASLIAAQHTMKPNQLGRPGIKRQVLVSKQGSPLSFQSSTSPLLASLKTSPKSSPQPMRPTPTLTTSENPVQLMQSGGRIIIPTTSGAQGNKTPVAYIISNSKTQPMLMSHSMGGLLMNKQATNNAMHNSARNSAVLSHRPMHQSTSVNLPIHGRHVMPSAPRSRMVATSVYKPSHPAPVPALAPQTQRQGWKVLPPKPSLKIKAAANGIMLSWHLPTYGNEHEEIKSYQIYAYQETSEEPDSKLWKTVGDVKALALPMACTLTQFKEGYKYHFSVRAVDIHNRMGASSETMSIILQKNHD